MFFGRDRGVRDGWACGSPAPVTVLSTADEEIGSPGFATADRVARSRLLTCARARASAGRRQPEDGAKRGGPVHDRGRGKGRPRRRRARPVASARSLSWPTSFSGSMRSMTRRRHHREHRMWSRAARSPTSLPPGRAAQVDARAATLAAAVEDRTVARSLEPVTSGYPHQGGGCVQSSSDGADARPSPPSSSGLA